MADDVQLKRVDPSEETGLEDNPFALFDGTKFVFNQSSWTAVNLYRMYMRYGTAPYRFQVTHINVPTVHTGSSHCRCWLTSIAVLQASRHPLNQFARAVHALRMPFANVCILHVSAREFFWTFNCYYTDVLSCMVCRASRARCLSCSRVYTIYK